MGTALILVVASFVPSQAALPEVTVAQIEAKVLASRRQIRRGKVSLEWTARKKEDTPTETAATIWFDHDKDQNRTDWAIKSKGGDPRRQIECRNCEKPGYYVFHSEVRQQGLGKSVIALAPLTAKNAIKLTLFDPRLIGFLPEHPGLLGHFNLETMLGKGDRLNQTLKQERLGGDDCYVIAFDIQNKQHWEYCVAPGKGYMLLRVGVTNTLPKTTTRSVVENDLQEFAPGNVWFPKTSTFTLYNKDKVHTKAVLRVNSAELNGPADAPPFSLAGMGLPEGATVNYTKPDGTSGPYSWKSHKLETYKRPPYVLPKPPQAQTRWWLFGLAGGLAVLALAAFALYWRRGSSAASLGGNP